MTALAETSPASARTPLFGSVVCVADATSSGHAARRQAAALAHDGGVVTQLVASRRGRADPRVVLDLAAGADVLVIGAGAAPEAVLLRASIPVLLSRWPSGDVEITERILLAVDSSVAPEPAAQLAGDLAAHHGGSVVVFPSIQRDAELWRAVSASRRIVSRRTGAWPQLHGARVPRETAIALAVRDLHASMLVVPMGDARRARARTVDLARVVTCPTLCVTSPARNPSGARDPQSVKRRAPQK